MNTNLIKLSKDKSIFIALLATAIVAFCAEQKVKTFKEVDTIFANPGQGWMNSRRFPCLVGYIRFNWADVEPERGQYNWDIIDRAIAIWKERGATIAFRVMTCNAHSSGYYSSPKWLFDAGCKGYEYLRGGDDPTSGGKRIPRIEPEYSDPIYLNAHAEFIQALGKCYDGNPDIEFIDIGSYGIWGEWHTPHPAPIEVRKKIIDMYVKAFPKTQLVFMTDDAEGLEYALGYGVGLRRDGVGSSWHEQNWIGSKKYTRIKDMGEVWKRAPIVFEWFGNYEYLMSRNYSFDAAVNFMLNNHVTLINDNIGKVPPEAMPQLEKLARLAGARLVLGQISHLSETMPGEPLLIKMKWKNVGVGKLYRQYVLRFILIDSNGNQVYFSDGNADPRQRLPGEYEVAETILLPNNLKPGKFSLGISLVDPDGRRRPFKLAIDAPETNGIYFVSEVIIAENTVKK